MSPIRPLHTCFRHVGLLLLALASLSTGCAHLPASGTFSQWLSDDSSEEASDPRSSCTVEFRDGSRNKSVTVPVSQTTRVQDVLDASRAKSKYRNLNVYVLRPTPQGPEPALKMACRFDRKERRIGFESDYAVRPGDRVVVSEDHSSKLDQIMSSIVGPVLTNR